MFEKRNLFNMTERACSRKCHFDNMSSPTDLIRSRRTFAAFFPMLEKSVTPPVPASVPV